LNEHEICFKIGGAKKEFGLNRKLRKWRVLVANSLGGVGIWDPAREKKISSINANISIDKFNPQGGFSMQIQGQNLFAYLSSPLRNKFEKIQIL